VDRDRVRGVSEGKDDKQTRRNGDKERGTKDVVVNRIVETAGKAQMTNLPWPKAPDFGLRR
jgi:hypothetical protein